MADDPKRIADAILGPLSEKESAVEDRSEGGEESFDTQTAALGATADQMLSAFKANDREGLVEALRSLVMMTRD